MVKNFRSSARPNEGTHGRQHKTLLRAHVPCPRTDFDGVGQNLVVVDHFRILHLQIFPTRAGHGEGVCVCSSPRAEALFNDFDYYRSRVTRDGDDPTSASTGDAQGGIQKRSGIDSGNSCRINFPHGASGDPRGHLSVVSVTRQNHRGAARERGGAASASSKDRVVGGRPGEVGGCPFWHSSHRVRRPRGKIVSNPTIELNSPTAQSCEIRQRRRSAQSQARNLIFAFDEHVSQSS
jgi:hypothetical protein